jgi:hypothetical protein
MNSVKPLQWAGIVLASLVPYLTYSHPQYFRDVSLLGGILLLEIIIATSELWAAFCSADDHLVWAACIPLQKA